MKPSTIQLLKDKPEECKEIFEEASRLISWDVFYKKHTAPDWEILEFKATKEHLIESFSIMNGEYLGHHGDDCTILNHSEVIQEVACGNYTIHSVRRSDGEVFEVGDKINRGGEIKSFKINNDKMIVNADKSWHLDDITKLKPLFKTEDGKDVYEWDETVKVHLVNFRIEYPYFYRGTDKNAKYFSTRSAAEQWVEEHRPSVSIAQIREFAEKDLPFQTVEALLLHLKSKK